MIDEGAVKGMFFAVVVGTALITAVVTILVWELAKWVLFHLVN